MFKIAILIAASGITLLANTVAFAATTTEPVYTQQILLNKTTRTACLKKKDHIWDSERKRCIHVPRGSY